MWLFVRVQRKMTEALERVTDVTVVDKRIPCWYFAVNDPQHLIA